MKLIIRSDSAGGTPILLTENGDPIEGVKDIELIIDNQGQDAEPLTARIVFYLSELKINLGTGK